LGGVVPFSELHNFRCKAFGTIEGSPGGKKIWGKPNQAKRAFIRGDTAKRQFPKKHTGKLVLPNRLNKRGSKGSPTEEKEKSSRGHEKDILQKLGIRSQQGLAGKRDLGQHEGAQLERSLRLGHISQVL